MNNEPERTGKEPERYEATDVGALKALAHPRRQRILDHLVRHGPATSATLARALDLNTGATSYHLRELARYGFVAETEAPDAHGRERWWRNVPRDIRFPRRSEQDTATRAVMDELNRMSVVRDAEEFQRAQETHGPADGSNPWADAFPYSRGTIRVTLPELAQFFEDYVALVTRYNRTAEEAPADTRVVYTRFLAFPAPPEEAGVELEGQGETDGETGEPSKPG